jgi:prolyl-tRNA synthetase
MGSYGIGIERSIACLVEENHDRKGIIWPKSVAPSQAHLIEIEAQNKQVRKFAKEVYEQLQRAGIEVLFDDREEVSAGEKFADADLIGIPTRLVVSEKTLRQDSGQDRIEWKERTSKKTLILSLDKVISRLK